MANKARYYGLATREELQDVSRSDRASRIYPHDLGYSAVITAILNYKDDHPNFDNLSTHVAAERIAAELSKQKIYGQVHANGSRVVGQGYSISLTKGNKTNGKIVPSKASEQVNTDKKRKKK